MRDEAEVRRPAKRGFVDPLRLQSGLDEAQQEDILAAFGNGLDYQWALDAQRDADDEQEGPDKPLELKDVFEPSQLVDRMLTDDDEIIRRTDVPERFQIARQPFRPIELSDEEMEARLQEETRWIAELMWPKKMGKLDRDMHEPFRAVIGNVLRFMNVEDLEQPFIASNRKDYLIHEERVRASPSPNDPEGLEYQTKASRLLQPADLWDIGELDLKYRAFAEKREALSKAVGTLKETPNFNDPIFDEMIPLAASMEELQDLQDYMHFQHGELLKDAIFAHPEANGTQKRAGGARSGWDRIRQAKVYHMVRAFGISADALAQNALKAGKKQYTEDPADRPDDLSDTLTDDQYATGEQVVNAAKAMFAEEIAMSPRMRTVMRKQAYQEGVFDVHRTEKGLRKIDEEHPFYEFKYLRAQTLPAIARRPEMFLRMLQAEDQGLVEVKLTLPDFKYFQREMYKHIQSDNISEVADAWNTMRRQVLDQAISKMLNSIVKGVKEHMKTECESIIARACRDNYFEKLDQAPYQPRGMLLGTEPRVLALSNGAGNRNDAICWVYMAEDGRVLENGKFSDIRLGNDEKMIPHGADVQKLVNLINHRQPDVVAVSGWSTECRRLYKDVQDIIDEFRLDGPLFETDDGHDMRERLDVIIVNDEVARLYHTSDRAQLEYPSLPPLARYTVALARYCQSPLKEYAALGRDVVSISFSPHQSLIPQEKVIKNLEMAMIEMVNQTGVDINKALSNPYTANLLPYVCGLGPRKAAQLIKVANQNGGEVSTREELVGDIDRQKRSAMGPKIYENCASFVYIEYDEDVEADYLDNTRIHPEDYETARKIVADTLDMDEEDIKAEIDEFGPNAVVRKLIKDQQEDSLNDLILDNYAEEIKRKLGLKKKATLELIRGELQNPYEELRRKFYLLGTDEIFTMLTGETSSSLQQGMIVPVQVKRTFPDHVEIKLDCGIEGLVPEAEYPSGVGGDGGLEPRQVWQTHQTIQAKIMSLDRKKLFAEMSLREDALRKPFQRDFDQNPGEWDEQQEAEDKKEAEQARDRATGRAQRVIKHPLFRPFNSAQAEEYLGSQSRGDVVIRPSSKGLDHLAVTWKVSEGVYQHIDVLELDKENEFSVGRTLKIGGRHTYSDLDELIVLHVQAMSRKVEEMMTDERYQAGSKAQTGMSFSSQPFPPIPPTHSLTNPHANTGPTEQWLNTYTEANPKRSMYAFCINPKYPGYFYICFKAGRDAPLASWPVKVIPNAYELQRHQYPDMRALKNGFKLLFQSGAARVNGGGGVRR